MGKKTKQPDYLELREEDFGVRDDDVEEAEPEKKENSFFGFEMDMSLAPQFI